MAKVLMWYTGEDDYIAGLKCGQLLDVETYTEDGRIYYGWINQYNEELYIYQHEVIPYG